MCIRDSYEYFSPVYSEHDAQANFNPITGYLDIPKDSLSLIHI